MMELGRERDLLTRNFNQIICLMSERSYKLTLHVHNVPYGTHCLSSRSIEQLCALHPNRSKNAPLIYNGYKHNYHLTNKHHNCNYKRCQRRTAEQVLSCIVEGKWENNTNKQTKDRQNTVCQWEYLQYILECKMHHLCVYMYIYQGKNISSHFFCTLFLQLHVLI